MSWSTVFITNEQGECVLRSLPPGPISAIVSTSRFHKWIKELPIPAKRDEVLEIVIANDCSADVRAVDRDVPLAGLRLELVDILGQDTVFDAKDTSPEGRARFEDLEQQEVELSVTALGHWPTRVRFTPTPTGIQQDVQVRRLGGARIRATLVGTPLRKRVIDLRSIEFDTDVLEWVTAGRVHASSGRLETDDDGRLVVDGLPNGPYRWTAKNSDGETVTGEFVVPARATTDVTVALP